MVQQHKITSRPLAKALGSASILSMAIVGANAANAIQTDVGVDYRAQAFAVSSEAFGDAGSSTDTDTGLAHLLRVKADFKHEETGVSLHTSTELAGDRWTGDGGRYSADSGNGSTGQTGAYNTSNTGDNVRLDLAYAQIPFSNGATLRVGRQAANWSNCFLVCDDRRDRVLGLIPTSVGTALAIYDRRQDTTQFHNEDNGDMAGLGLVTKLGGFNVGLLYVHWFKEANEESIAPDDPDDPAPYALSGTHLFSPYISGQLGDNLNLTTGFTFVTGGSTTHPVNEDQYFNENAWSEYVRFGMSAGGVQFNLQGLAAQDGGLISGGFETYSSLINSSPESTESPTSLVRMGSGLGLKDYNEYLVSAQAVIPVGNQLSFKVGVGTYNVDNGTDDDSSTFVDLQAHYKLNEAVSTSLTWGMLTKNDVAITAGNSLAPAGGHSFADDDLMAASANIYVKF